jgi:hypothetical protein
MNATKREILPIFFDAQTYQMVYNSCTWVSLEHFVYFVSCSRCSWSLFILFLQNSSRLNSPLLKTMHTETRDGAKIIGPDFTRYLHCKICVLFVWENRDTTDMWRYYCIILINLTYHMWWWCPVYKWDLHDTRRYYSSNWSATSLSIGW